MSKRSGPNKENYDETRRVFLDVALEEFCEYGYPEASTTRIVKQSGMARGSLYYHFGDKYGLFETIYSNMMHSAQAILSDKMDAQPDAWNALMTGSEAFLDLCMDSKFRTIVLFESQSAMSFKTRMVIVKQTIMKKLDEILPTLIADGAFPGHTKDTAGVFIMGYLAEIGRSFDSSPDINAARELHVHAFRKTIEKLKN